MVPPARGQADGVHRAARGAGALAAASAGACAATTAATAATAAENADAGSVCVTYDAASRGAATRVAASAETGSYADFSESDDARDLVAFDARAEAAMAGGLDSAAKMIDMHSVETRMKISVALKGKKKPVGFKPSNVFKKGSVPWNKGSKGVMVAWNKGKKMSDEFVQKCVLRQLGKPMSEAAKNKLREKSIGKAPSKNCIAALKQGKHNVGRGPHSELHNERIARSVVVAQQFSRWRRFEYKGVFFRSGWEMKVAKWLDDQCIRWSYESMFLKTPFGVYVPDFCLIECGDFLEVKGVRNDRQSKKIEWLELNGHVIHVVDKTNVGDISLGRTWADHLKATTEKKTDVSSQ